MGLAQQRNEDPITVNEASEAEIEQNYMDEEQVSFNLEDQVCAEKIEGNRRKYLCCIKLLISSLKKKQ